MRKRLIALSFYIVYWMVFFIFARLFFIIFQFHNSFHYSFGELLATLVHGSKLDVPTTGYYLLVPLLFAIPGIYFNGNWYRFFLRWYTYLMLVFSAIIVVSDPSLYSYWGFRMDYTPMLYLKTPGEALAFVA